MADKPEGLWSEDEVHIFVECVRPGPFCECTAAVDKSPRVPSAPPPCPPLNPHAGRQGAKVLGAARQTGQALAVIGAVVAEFVAADKGLGYFIQFSTSMFKVQQAWAGLVILVLMSLILFQIVVAVQKIWFPWSLPKDKI